MAWQGRLAAECMRHRCSLGGMEFSVASVLARWHGVRGETDDPLPRVSLRRDVDHLLARLATAIEENEVPRVRRLPDRPSMSPTECAELRRVSHREIAFLRRIAYIARSVSALQPDGSEVPARRCDEAAQQVRRLASSRERVVQKLGAEARGYQRAVESEITTAEMTALIWALKLEALVQRKMRDIRAVRYRSGGGEEGGEGMSIEDFTIIKPISRGAHGRVYLAQVKQSKRVRLLLVCPLVPCYEWPTRCDTGVHCEHL